MFIRLKKNQSGSTSVILVSGERIPGKRHVVSRVIKNFGASIDKEKLEKLQIEAESYKAKLLLASPKTKLLKIAQGPDIRSCRSYNTGFDDIFGKLFFETFRSIDSDIDPKLLCRLKDLVVLRIAEPCSKLMSSKFAPQYNYDLKVHNIYRLMDKMDSKTILKMKQIICKSTHALLEDIGASVDIMFYDLTTISFETNKVDDIRDFGFSKDGKHHHVQMVLAVMVTNDGLPISYEYFPGSTYEGHTLTLALEKIKSEYNIGRIVVVADSALMTKVNIGQLESLGYEYIISAKLRGGGVSKDIKHFCLNDKTNETLLLEKSDKVSGEITDIIHSKELISESSKDSKSQSRLVVFHSTKRQAKDALERNKNLEKIEKYLNSSSSKSSLTYSLKKSYISLKSKDKITIDEQKLEECKKFDGYFGIVTNIKDIDHLQLLTSYQGLWQIEQSFRITKHNLKIRPVYHFSPRRIAAHIAICYIALSMIRYLEFKLKIKATDITLEQLTLTLSQIRRVEIIDSLGQSFNILEDPPPQAAELYKALDIKFPKKFISR